MRQLFQTTNYANLKKATKSLLHEAIANLEVSNN